MTLLVLVSASCGGGQTSPTGPNAPTSSSGVDTGSGAGSDQPSGPAKAVDCGDFSTCAIASDDLARCWGRDKKGELGDGVGGEARSKRALVPALGKVRKIALASEFACAVLADKTVKCWGTGRIANDNQSVSEAKPTQVKGVENVEELVASGVLACARNSQGITCWGADAQTIGTPPKGQWKQIAAGFTHACALDGSGAIVCWGQADWATDGAFGKPAISGALEVVTGDRHGCVITKDRGVQCWGMNDAGQLGIKSDTEPHKKPVTVPGLSGVSKLTAGEASTCALLGDGSVRCWGANGEGELGLGSRSPEERPTKVAALSGVEHICLASAHGCALTAQKKLLCWGSNAFGQLGDGTKERRSEPTPVVW